MVKAQIKKAVLELVQGDITQESTEVIVNAANTSLLGGGGVDDAIHRAAGPKLVEHCKTLGGCTTGDAKITPGFNLKAKFVIHTVGPVYHDGKRKEAERLQMCYQRCLEIALENEVNSIAFPSISTGAYGYPLEEAAPIALRTVCAFLNTNDKPNYVRFILYGNTAYETYTAALQRLLRESSI